MSNYGTIGPVKPRFALDFTKQSQRTHSSRLISPRTWQRITAQTKLNMGRELSPEDRAWLDRPIPRRYPPL